MTTMLSLILAFMLSIGGSPAAGVNPGGCPGDTGIQAPIDNNRTINHFSGDYNQKTASRAKSKKVGETSSIQDLETVNSIRFSRFSIEKLRQPRYSDHKSFRFNSVDPVITNGKALSDPQLWNLYVYCRNNPIKFIDPDGRVLMTTQIKTMQQIAGPAASMIKIVGGKLDVSGLSQSAMANNEGAKLLYDLATSKHVYSYSEGATGGVSNLDNKPDWRYPGGKSSKFLPPTGVDCAVEIDPSIKYVDAATGTLSVSNAAIAFHELAEAYGKIDLGMPYMQKGGGAGAHEYSRKREKKLINQRPGFTNYAAGETIKKK